MKNGLIMDILTTGAGVIAGRFVNEIGFVKDNPSMAGIIKIAGGYFLASSQKGMVSNLGKGLALAGVVDMAQSAGVGTLNSTWSVSRIAGASSYAPPVIVGG